MCNSVDGLRAPAVGACGYRVARILSAHVYEKLRTIRQYGKGMKPLDSRQAILRCNQPLKAVVGM